MPRRSNAEAQRTRETIIDQAVQTASVEGLEGVTIGRLAGDVGMSKAGVIGHFGNKTDLQRAALLQAQAIFTEEVWGPAEHREPGIERLRAICDAWVAHLVDCPFEGGCFMTTASTEWDARQGELREDVRSGMERWRKVLRREARTAIAAGDLSAENDPGQIAFELLAIAMGLNQAIQLLGDRHAPDRARHAMRRLLEG
jgi:AcrR family transcriptional regulator